MEWIFEGIGTELLSLALGMLVGSGAGYKLGIKKSTKQMQKAGNSSTQTQIGEINEK